MIAASTAKNVTMPSRMADGHRVGGSTNRRRATTSNTPHSAARITATTAVIVPARLSSCQMIPGPNHPDSTIATGGPSLNFSYA